MKVKQTPEDFQVTEITDISSSPRGPFALYRLSKRHLGTPEAVQTVCRALRVDPRRVSYGGLKDTHALTLQHLTIEHGPARNWRGSGIELSYLHQTAEAFQSKHITGNQFTLVLRDFTVHQRSACMRHLTEVGSNGVPNYFDDQRFGSVSPDGQFIARHLVDGSFEKALHLALCGDYAFDQAQQRKQKQRLRDSWGDWVRWCQDLPPGPARSVALYLAHHPTDFRGALRQLPHQTLTLYLAAYQSHLWNRMLATWLSEKFPGVRLSHLQQKRQTLPAPTSLSQSEREELLRTELPLPSARLKLPEGSPWQGVLQKVMADEGIPLTKIQLKHWRELFFSKGERAAWFLPRDLRWEPLPGMDSQHGDLRLAFTLPRGCYATMLVKRATVES